MVKETKYYMEKERWIPTKKFEIFFHMIMFLFILAQGIISLELDYPTNIIFILFDVLLAGYLAWLSKIYVEGDFFKKEKVKIPIFKEDM